jgi:hypothetical protein
MLTAKLKLILSTLAIITLLLGTVGYLLVRDSSPGGVSRPQSRPTRSQDDRLVIDDVLPLEMQGERNRQQRPPQPTTTTEHRERTLEMVGPQVIRQ